MKRASHRPGLYTVLIGLGVSYIGAYFLLMVRFLPVVEKGSVRFKSTFRWAASAPRSGPYYMSEGKKSVFNFFFLPADFAFYSIWKFDPKGTNRNEIEAQQE